MAVETEQRADRFRRGAQLYGWKECSYLVVRQDKVELWAANRSECMRLMQSFMFASAFASYPGHHPGTDRILVSLVVCDDEGKTQLYHLVSDKKPPDSLLLSSGTAPGPISSRDVYRCELGHCDCGDQMPIVNSRLESSTVPEHPDALQPN